MYTSLHFVQLFVCLCVPTVFVCETVYTCQMTHVSCMLVWRCLCVSASVLVCIDWWLQQVDVSDRLNYSNQSLLTPHLSATHTSLLSSSVSPPLPPYSATLLLSLCFSFLFFFIYVSPITWLCLLLFCVRLWPLSSFFYLHL